MPVYITYKGKGKVHPTTSREDPEAEWRFSSTLFLTLQYFTMHLKRSIVADKIRMIVSVSCLYRIPPDDGQLFVRNVSRII
jgi:hypothetical protein